MRQFIREPIPEIFASYRNLSAAVDAHLSGDYPKAKSLFAEANDPKVWHWLDDVWTHTCKHIVHKKPPGDTHEIPAAERDPDRHIAPAVRPEVLKRDGYLMTGDHWREGSLEEALRSRILLAVAERAEGISSKRAARSR